MNQICDGYNPRVRMGNWFQESFSVPQPSRDAPAKVSRESDITIGYVDAHLKLRPLNRIARLQQWNTNELVGHSSCAQPNMKSTIKENYDIGTTLNHFKHWKPFLHAKQNEDKCGQGGYLMVSTFKKEHRMFNQKNVNELVNERSADTVSFKSKLQPNKHIYYKQMLQTTYQKEFNKCQPLLNRSNSTASISRFGQNLQSPSLGESNRQRGRFINTNLDLKTSITQYSIRYRKQNSQFVMEDNIKHFLQNQPIELIETIHEVQ